MPENVQTFPSTGLSLGAALDAASHATPLDDLESVVALYQPRV